MSSTRVIETSNKTRSPSDRSCCYREDDGTLVTPIMPAKNPPKPLSAPKPKVLKRPKPALAGMKITKSKNGKIRAVTTANPGLKVRKHSSGKGFSSEVVQLTTSAPVQLKL